MKKFMKMKKLVMISAVAGVIVVGGNALLAAPLTFVETFNGTNAASGSGSGNVFDPGGTGLDNTGWTGATTDVIVGIGINAGGGYMSMVAGDAVLGGARQASLWRIIGEGDDVTAHLDATTTSDGLQAIKGTVFSWIFRDDTDNAFRVAVDVVDYDNIRLQVDREKGGASLSLLDIDMTDNGLGDAPDPPVTTDIHQMRLDWTVTWDQATTEWDFEGTVVLQNDAGTITIGSYTQTLVMTTDYEASEAGREMTLLQEYDGNAVGHEGYRIPFSAVGMNEVTLVPEPGTVVMLVCGLATLLFGAAIRRRRRRA